MINLFKFLVKNGAVFVFLILQAFCFWMVVTFNETHRTIFLHNSVLVTGGVQEKITNFYDYWSLYHISDSLAEENAQLMRQLLVSYTKEGGYENREVVAPDSLDISPAKIIYNSITNRNNNLLINRGLSHGIDKGMGVTDGLNGLVGITSECSENYCRVLSILHTQSSISAKIKNRGYFGSLVWRTLNPHLLHLESIPIHATFEVGDTVVTSGYSIVFPENLPIGTIESKELSQGSNFYQVDVRLFNDLSKAKYVYVISDPQNEEKRQLIKPFMYE